MGYSRRPPPAPPPPMKVTGDQLVTLHDPPLPPRLHAVLDPQPVPFWLLAAEALQLVLFVLGVAYAVGLAGCSAEHDFCDSSGVIVAWTSWFTVLVFRGVCARRTKTFRSLKSLRGTRVGSRRGGGGGGHRGGGGYRGGGLGRSDQTGSKRESSPPPSSTSRTTSANHAPIQGLSKVGAIAQAIIESPCHVGISVRCHHTETQVESYVDNQGNRATRTRSVTVTTFSHFYDLSDAVDSMDQTHFSGRDVLKMSTLSDYVAFDSVVGFDVSPELGVLLAHWKMHLYEANQHRDHLTTASVDIAPRVPVQAEQLAHVPSAAGNREGGGGGGGRACCCRCGGGGGGDLLVSPVAFQWSVLLHLNCLFIYLFERRISRCKLHYQKVCWLREGMHAFSPRACGGESFVPGMNSPPPRWYPPVNPVGAGNLAGNLVVEASPMAVVHEIECVGENGGAEIEQVGAVPGFMAPRPPTPQRL